ISFKFYADLPTSYSPASKIRFQDEPSDDSWAESSVTYKNILQFPLSLGNNLTKGATIRYTNTTSSPVIPNYSPFSLNPNDNDVEPPFSSVIPGKTVKKSRPSLVLSLSLKHPFSLTRNNSNN